MRALTIVAASLGLTLVGACSISGDGTPGEEGRSTWQIDDGLCPGLGGGCDLRVPIAAGTDPHVDAHVDGRAIDALSVDVQGPATLFELDRDSRAGRIDLDLQTTGPGTVTLELIDRDGASFDRATFEVREAVDMDCGWLPSGADWAMTGLDQVEAVTVDFRDASGVVELGCVLRDDAGAPLLSARGIQWRVLTADDDFRLDDGGIVGGGDVGGARVYARFRLRGDSATVEARFEGMTRQITVATE